MTNRTRSDEQPWFGKPLAADKAPRKKNLCEEIIHATGALELVPVFPYLDKGAIVACLSVAIGGANFKGFQFFHYNVVPEVLLCLSGQNSSVSGGQMMVLPDQHGVNAFLKDMHDPGAYFVALIVIRMSEDEEQVEGFILRCEECNEILCKRYANIKEGPDRPYYPEFRALAFYADVVDEFNASDRVCPRCGHMNEPFPAEQMGWRRYAQQIDVANRARASLEESARELAEQVAG